MGRTSHVVKARFKVERGGGGGRYVVTRDQNFYLGGGGGKSERGRACSVIK